MTLRTQVFSALRWTVGARLVSQVATWAMTLVVIRLLAPSDYGLLAMASVLIAFLAMLSDIGVGPALVQRESVDDDHLRKGFGIVLLVHFGAALIVFAAAPLMAIFFDTPRLTAVMRVMASQFVIVAFGVIPDALLQRNMEFKKRSLLDLTVAVVGGAMTLTFAFAGYGVWALVAGNLTMALCRTIGLNLFHPSLQLPSFRFAGMGTLLRFGGNITLSGVLWFFFTQADVFIAGKWLGKEALGAYSVAMHLASLPNQRISALINQVTFPAFSRMQGDRSRVAAASLLGIRILSFVTFPVAWGISSIAPEIVGVILGSRWGAATLPLRIIALIMPMRMISTFVPNAVQGIGRADVVLKNAVWSVAIMLPAFLAGAYFGGLRGLVLALLIGTLLSFFNNISRSATALGLSIRDVLRAMGPATLVGAAMYLVVSLVHRWLATGMPRLADLLILILVGAVTYAVASWLGNRRGFSEILRVFGEFANMKPRGDVAPKAG